jgi:negative regulator of flagellin synthesis FlgM
VKIDPPVTPPATGPSDKTAGSAGNSSISPRAPQADTANSSNAAPTGTHGEPNVSLSPLSSQLRGLGADASTADINTERVASLKDAISKGQLPIDTSKIADGLIATARSLLKAPGA